MKNTHFKTPRTLEECEFQVWADPIQKFEENDGFPVWVIVCCIALVCMLVGVLAWM